MEQQEPKHLSQDIDDIDAVIHDITAILASYDREEQEAQDDVIAEDILKEIEHA